MPRARQTAIFEDHEISYFFRVTFSQDKETFNTLRLAIPGVSSDGFPSIRAPMEMDQRVSEILQTCGYRVEDRRTVSGASPALVLSHPVAHPYQTQLAGRLLAERVVLAAHEMGLGKSLPVVLSLQELEGWESCLIVAPANIRGERAKRGGKKATGVWIEEFEKWWPDHPKVTIVDSGAQVVKLTGTEKIVVTSYGLTGKLPARRWDVIVLDESHYFANAKQAGRPVQRSAHVRKLLDRNRDAYIWALTGTPITNEPINLHNQLDCLWPGRFGKYWDFAYHYCNVEATDYTDYWVHGVNGAYAAELEERLTWCVDRRTKAEPEVAKYMPPFRCTPIRVRAKRDFKPRELWASLSRTDFHREKSAAEAVIRSCGVQKIGEAVAWTADAIEAGQKICVLTHLKQSAKDIEAELKKKKVTVWRFDGNQSVGQREALIQTALKHKGPCALVCTMHSVKEGINSLAGFDGALFAELYYTPGVMKQALMRFWRAHMSCNVWILFVEGSHEEVIAMRLAEKIENESRLIKQDKTGQLLSGALGDNGDESEALERLRKVAVKRVSEEVY